MLDCRDVTRTWWKMFLCMMPVKSEMLELFSKQSQQTLTPACLFACTLETWWDTHTCSYKTSVIFVRFWTNISDSALFFNSSKFYEDIFDNFFSFENIYLRIDSVVKIGETQVCQQHNKIKPFQRGEVDQIRRDLNRWQIPDAHLLMN